MAWTQPKTWGNEPLVASDMNTYLRDNMEALKDPAFDFYQLTANVTTTSTSFVDVDSNMSFTIDTNGGVIFAVFNGYIRNTSGTINLNVALDGTPVVADDGIVRTISSIAQELHISFVLPITGLPAGEYTISLQWKVNAGTAEMYGGSKSSPGKIYSNFWVREIS